MGTFGFLKGLLLVLRRRRRPPEPRQGGGPPLRQAFGRKSFQIAVAAGALAPAALLYSLSLGALPDRWGSVSSAWTALIPGPGFERASRFATYWGEPRTELALTLLYGLPTVLLVLVPAEVGIAFVFSGILFYGLETVGMRTYPAYWSRAWLYSELVFLLFWAGGALVLPLMGCLRSAFGPGLCSSPADLLGQAWERAFRGRDSAASLPQLPP